MNEETGFTNEELNELLGEGTQEEAPTKEEEEDLLAPKAKEEAPSQKSESIDKDTLMQVITEQKEMIAKLLKKDEVDPMKERKEYYKNLELPELEKISLLEKELEELKSFKNQSEEEKARAKELEERGAGLREAEKEIGRLYPDLNLDSVANIVDKILGVTEGKKESLLFAAKLANALQKAKPKADTVVRSQSSTISRDDNKGSGIFENDFSDDIASLVAQLKD